jgi:endonuclease/exonuclease/phosphatase family metal-dependent hydrolase
VKLLTMNVHKGFAQFGDRFILPDLRAAIRETGADLVFLQEVHGRHSGHPRRVRDWPELSQYEFLADTLWPAFAYGRNAVYPDGDHGNALLSKRPIVRQRNLDVSVRGAESRGLLHCQIAGEAGELHAISVHLGLRERERRRQLDLLLALLAELPPAAPVVVAGDFNDWRGRTGRVLREGAGLEEVFARARGAPARTYPAFWPLLRLDRIYLRNLRANPPAVLSGRPWSRLSDHLPLTVSVMED